MFNHNLVVARPLHYQIEFRTGRGGGCRCRPLGVVCAVPHLEAFSVSFRMLCRIGRASATLVAARGVRSRALRAAPKVVVQSRILARQSPLRTTSVRLYSGEAPAFDVLAKQIEDKLRAGLKDVKHVTIQDARGMFQK